MKDASKRTLEWKLALVLMSFALVIYATKLTYVGLHNIDLSTNVLQLSRLYGLPYEELVDRDNKGDVRTITEMYILGLNQISDASKWYIISFAITFVAVFIRIGGNKNEQRRKRRIG